MMREIKTCPVCAGENVAPVATMDADRAARFQAFSARKYDGLMDRWIDGIALTVLRCASCGHCFHSHQPDEDSLSAMYAAGRPLYDKAAPSREPSAAMLAEMARLRRLVGGAGKPRLLDYGSGFGRWARAALAAGFEVTAFEPSAPRGQETDAPFELVHDAALLQGRVFDVVNVEQVLEHVPDPVALLASLKPLCAPGAVLRLTVPNILRPYEGERLWADWPFDGARIHTMAPFEHLHGFTPDSLHVAARQAGFERLPSCRLWRHYPLSQIRRLASFFKPEYGQTLALVRLGA